VFQVVWNNHILEQKYRLLWVLFIRILVKQRGMFMFWGGDNPRCNIWVLYAHTSASIQNVAQPDDSFKGNLDENEKGRL